MLTQEQNDLLTRVGPGTPMGELMRRYWQPVAPAAELGNNPTKEVRLLGEDLVLYRDRSGTYGLVGRYCAHRRVNLAYGIPEERGLRCMYHGWLYDETGRCAEQPFEETVRPEARFKDKIKLPGYPVQEMGGILFAYLGPEPAPLLPRWEYLVMEGNVLREMFVTELPCNWLQCQENSLDPVHLEWLHGYYGSYVAERHGGPLASFRTGAGHKKIGFDVFEHGIVKRRVWGKTTEDDEAWRVGHPVLFPNILHNYAGQGRYFLQYRVPIDDENTWHLDYICYALPPEVEAPKQDVVPYQYVSPYNEQGRLRFEDVLSQDMMVWVAQGALMDRSQERLGESDVGVILFRKLLQEQMAIVEDGGDPMAVIRDPATNDALAIPQEGRGYIPLTANLANGARPPSVTTDLIMDLLAKVEQVG